MDVGERRELYSGFGDSLVWAVEFAVTPVLFGLIGHFLGSRLGLGPWLTIAFVLFAIVGLAVRAYYGYVAAMEAHAANAPWASSPRKQSLLSSARWNDRACSPKANEPGSEASETNEHARSFRRAELGELNGASADRQSRIGSGADDLPLAGRG